MLELATFDLFFVDIHVCMFLVCVPCPSLQRKNVQMNDTVLHCCYEYKVCVVWCGVCVCVCVWCVCVCVYVCVYVLFAYVTVLLCNGMMRMPVS